MFDPAGLAQRVTEMFQMLQEFDDPTRVLLDQPFGRPVVAAQPHLEVFLAVPCEGNRLNTEEQADEALFAMKGERIADAIRDDRILCLLRRLTPRITRMLVQRFRRGSHTYPTIEIIDQILGEMEGEGIFYGL